MTFITPRYWYTIYGYVHVVQLWPSLCHVMLSLQTGSRQGRKKKLAIEQSEQCFIWAPLKPVDSVA